MTFSNAVAQQRVKQTVTLKRFVACSLIGSLAAHGLGMSLKVAQFEVDEEVAPEEITIVVTDLPEEIPPEEEMVVGVVPDPAAPAVAIAPAAATAVEVPVEPAVTEESVQEEVDDELEPTPSPVADVPIEEEIPEETVEEPTFDEPTPESISDEPTEQVAETPGPSPRNLRDLLNDLRQSRSPSTSTETAAATDTTPNRAPRGFAPGQFSRPGMTGEETTAVGPTSPGIGEGPPADSSGEGEDPRPSQGTRSREITCEGCDFDYPDEAEGAEGEAQVIVETDDQGNVVSVTLSRSTGNAALDRAALEQARQRVRLNNAQGGESYPIDIEFVQPNSDAARRARDRGDRRSITVTEPEPDTAPDTASEQTPETATSPEEQTANPESDASTDPNLAVEEDDSASDSSTDAETSPEPVDADASPTPSPDAPNETDADAPPLSPAQSPAQAPTSEPTPSSTSQPSPSAAPSPRPNPPSEVPPPAQPSTPVPAPAENRSPVPVAPPVEASPSESVDAE